jgi:tetratricopeptide (TPR) repeat protein
MRAAVWVFAFAAVAGGAVWLFVSRRSDAGSERLLADLTADIDRGGVADLGRAQAVGRRLAFSSPRDREAAGRWAFASAMLAADYGVDTSRETADALTRFGASPPTDPASVIAASARALDRLFAGDREGAARVAAEAAAADSELPHPLYALGRVRARGGDLAGAARALEAAMIRAPGFAPAQVAWAEVQLDLGDAKAARGALQKLLAQAPRDLRVGLMLNEAEAALDEPATGPTAGDCPTERWVPPAIIARCTLARATRARRAGSRVEARGLAETAAGLAPNEPRLLSRIALALCQLGEVDRAASLLERARRAMAPGAPALAWAEAALSLGRGHAGSLPAGGRPADPEIRLLATRENLAAGGVGALSAALDELGAGARAHDVDLAALAGLLPAAGNAARATSADPVRAYVDGLRGRLDGKLDVAADRLRYALSAHGDACRAAGEHRATLRALKQKPEASAFAALRAENSGCVNLPKP